MPDNARPVEEFGPPVENGLPHPALVGAMRAAADWIQAVRARGVVARDKTDDSPVTEADEGAEQILADAILHIEPDAVIVGEEGVAAGHRPDVARRFWLIDPLDGTRDFVNGGSAYTVNVGLIIDGAPVLGLVLHPPTGRLWMGVAGHGSVLKGMGDTLYPLTPRPLAGAPRIVVSHSHLDARTQAWIDAVPGAQRTSAGSSIKLCMLAEGTADAYPRFGPVMEWDTAAGDAILRAAGGIMLDEHGLPYRYGKPDYANTPFLALADAASQGKLPNLNCLS